MGASLILLAGLCLMPAIHAQQSPSAEAAPGSTTEVARKGGGETKDDADSDKWVFWKWANFAILAGGLFWLTRKSVPAFFASRTESIQKDITESARLRQEAESRATEIDKRLSALESEITRMATEIRAEFAHEGERIRKETERHLERIQHQAEQEIEATGRGARDELRRDAAKLALELAEQRIRERMDAPTQSRLVKGFVRSLEDTRPGDGVRA